MKSSQITSPLDNFVSGMLKNTDGNFQPFDWSEIEVLLKHEQRSIPVQVNKKTFLIVTAATCGMILLFSIVKVVQYYSSLPDEPVPITGPTQNTFSPIDTADVTALDTSTLNVGAGKVDSTALFISIKRKSDSVSALVAADTAARIKANVILPVAKLKDKKKKTDTTQKITVSDTVAVKIVADTVSKPVAKEIIIETPAATDTASKKVSPENKGSKKKKTKLKKTMPSPNEQKTDLPVSKPDSLKQ